MAVSYKKLFKMLIDRDMKKKDFREFVGICLKLDCGIDDIMEILPDSPDNGTSQGVE